MWGSNAHGAVGVVDQDEAGEVLAEQFVSYTFPPSPPTSRFHIFFHLVVRLSSFTSLLHHAYHFCLFYMTYRLAHVKSPRFVRELANVSIIQVACGNQFWYHDLPFHFYYIVNHCASPLSSSFSCFSSSL